VACMKCSSLLLRAPIPAAEFWALSTVGSSNISTQLSITCSIVLVCLFLLLLQGAALWYQGLRQTMRAAAANATGDTTWPLYSSKPIAGVSRDLHYVYMLSSGLCGCTCTDVGEPYNTPYAAAAVHCSQSHGLLTFFSFMHKFPFVLQPAASETRCRETSDCTM
jgi:hypothetical protein